MKTKKQIKKDILERYHQMPLEEKRLRRNTYSQSLRDIRDEHKKEFQTIHKRNMVKMRILLKKVNHNTPTK